MSLQHAVYCPGMAPVQLGAALDTWQAEGMPAGVLALLPEAEHERLGSLAEVCAARGLHLFGAIFPEIVVDSAFHAEGALLLPLANAKDVVLVPDLPEGAGQAAARIVERVVERIVEGGGAGQGGRKSTLFMIFDAMVPSIGSILDALYLQLADRVAYAGVNAGSESFRPMPCLFQGHRVSGGGVLCVLLPDAAGAVLDHGYVAPREIITATSTRANRIFSIDWRPAFEVYSEQVRSLYATELTRDNFYQYAIHFPFGILLANNDLIVRIPVALEPDGSLFCVGEVPENAVLTLLRAPRVDSAQSVDRIAFQLRDQFGDTSERDMLTFYCAGRRLHLGRDAAVNELRSLSARMAGGRQLGALSLGEIGSLRAAGYPMFHNATLVCRPWA